MRSYLTVTYNYIDDRAVYELRIENRDLINLVFDDYWFRVVGLESGNVYFACPRERIISIKEK